MGDSESPIKSAAEVLSELVQSIYSRFFLRDVLGYAFPGAVFLGAVATAVGFSVGIVPTAGSLRALLARTGEIHTMVWVLLALASYAAGHGVSGITYHAVANNRWFNHLPWEPFQGDRDDRQLVEFNQKFHDCLTAGGEHHAVQAERFAALEHFTGHLAGALLLGMAPLIFAGLRLDWWLSAVYAALVIGGGCYAHRVRLAQQRYLLMVTVIEASGSKSMAARDLAPGRITSPLPSPDEGRGAVNNAADRSHATAGQNAQANRRKPR
jgi:hypothetical protein